MEDIEDMLFSYQKRIKIYIYVYYIHSKSKNVMYDGFFFHIGVIRPKYKHYQ